MKPTTWKCKDGKFVQIKEMGDSHLVNSIALLRKSYRRICLAGALAADSAYPDGEPDGAAMVAESEARYLFEEAETQEDIAERWPIYGALDKEVKRRRIAVP